MDKFLINNTNDLLYVIRKCYESDPLFINNYHELTGGPLNKCIYRTVKDLKNVDVYSLYSNDQLIGYFGDNKFNWLTGFFILPEFRNMKKEVWNLIDNHFNNSFKVGILHKNKPAIKYFIENGCKFSHYEPSVDGLGGIYIKENN